MIAIKGRHSANQIGVTIRHPERSRGISKIAVKHEILRQAQDDKEP
jgi:hypothetical protein